MNFLTVGAKLNRQMEKLRRNFDNLVAAGGISQERADEEAKKMVFAQYERDVRTGLEAMQKFQEIAAEMGHGSDGSWYFITVRPPSDNFQAFYTAIAKTLQRKCFLRFLASFEQKGVTESTLGEGYHVHIVAKMRQRSKGEVLRDLASSLRTICAENFIDVKVTKNGEQMFRRYCIDYESEDGHKIVTKEFDALWRRRMNLQDYYDDVMPTLRVELLTS